MVYKKQYPLIGGIAEITVNHNVLKDLGVVVPIMSLFISEDWPLQKPRGSWKMAVGYHKCNQGVTPSAAAVWNVVFLLEQINTDSCMQSLN